VSWAACDDAWLGGAGGATGAPAAALPQMALVLIDEVHLLNESGRGSALEAGVVCRIKMVGRLKEMQQVRAPWPAAGGGR
jgi:hypothetical protein